MLARSLKIDLPNGDYIDTPILLPSFSSKGFPELKKIIKYIEEHLYGPILISSYDWHYKLIQKRIKFLNKLVFIDSGGYECASIMDFAENELPNYKAQKWNYQLFKNCLEEIIKLNTPKVIISYDHPRLRKKVEEQIFFAKENFSYFEKLGHIFLKEILIKPESLKREEQFINFENLIQNINELKHFDIIGFTEKELGKSFFDRINNLSKFRLSLQEKNMNLPIHIFGCLDTISTPLLFMCGADIFDGLTWLRFAYHEETTIYQSNYWLKKYPLTKADGYSKLNMFVDNFNYLQQLSLKMRRFIKTHDFSEFAPHHELLEEAWNSLEFHNRGGA